MRIRELLNNDQKLASNENLRKDGRYKGPQLASVYSLCYGSPTMEQEIYMVEKVMESRITVFVRTVF
jgi:hypothetical protein